VEGSDASLSRLDVSAYQKMIQRAVASYPNLKLAATTLRAVKSATRNDWGAVCWAGGKFYEASPRSDLEVLDRVGGGDSFASGLIYGLLTFNDPQKAVDYGAAHGALAMTTPGDNSMASLREVEALIKGASPRVQR
jgi:2-dehydro-3-deoxygluconokinase